MKLVSTNINFKKEDNAKIKKISSGIKKLKTKKKSFLIFFNTKVERINLFKVPFKK